MTHSRLIILSIFCFVGMISCAQKGPTFKPETSSLLTFVGEGNEIKVWNAVTNKTTVIADLNDEIRINQISFSDSNTVNYSVFHRPTKLAVLKETGDTLVCPCSEDDEYIVNGIVASDRYDQIEYYMDTVRAISIADGLIWIDKIIKYQHTDNMNVLIETTTFDVNGEVLSKKDSSYTCESVSNNNIRCQCQKRIPDRHTMYSQSETQNGTYFFTRNGHLYKSKSKVEDLFFEYTGEFEYKFGRGYYHPTLNYDASKAVVAYSETGFYTGLSDVPSALLLIDVQTKEVDTISNDNLQFPVFSTNGEFIVTTRNPLAFVDQEQEIRIYDLQNDKHINLGVGYLPIWFDKEEHIRSY